MAVHGCKVQTFQELLAFLNVPTKTETTIVFLLCRVLASELKDTVSSTRYPVLGLLLGSATLLLRFQYALFSYFFR
jgi:hypothetical protein